MLSSVFPPLANSILGGLGQGTAVGGTLGSQQLQNVTNDLWNHPATDNAWWIASAVSSTSCGTLARNEIVEQLFPDQVCTKSGAAACRQFEEAGADVSVVDQNQAIRVACYDEKSKVAFSFDFQVDKEWTVEELQWYLNIITGKKLKCR